jgi:5-methylcytosine-specific restriction protein A
MPMRAPRICKCGSTVAGGQKCPLCTPARNRAYEARRPTARERGYDSKWERESKAFLALPENKFCSCGCGRRADMVDHKVRHRGDKRLFWARSNWQPMASSPCHSSMKQRQERADG